MLTQIAIRNPAIRTVPQYLTVAALPRIPGHRAFDETAEPESLDETMQLMGAVMSYPRNSEVFAEDEPADYIYKMVSGSVRTCKILSDGRRQISAFYRPGDIFGLQSDDEHSLTAEAITDVKVLVVKRTAFNTLAGRNTAIAREIFAITSRDLRRMQKRILLLIKSAEERVVSFLHEMAEQTPASNVIDLPMTRQDIADYLGLTIETVSRTLTGLQCAAMIEMPTSRRIVLRNRSALSHMNG
jgi:CRP/FNR family transcriptional regulator, nitrogen fixation regulation protein